MFSPSPALQPPARLLVERALDGRPGRGWYVGALVGEVAEERVRRDSPSFLPGGGADGAVGGDDGHRLAPAVLGGEALEEIVRVGGEAHGQGPDAHVLAHAVEHDHAARALEGDVIRQPVGQLAAVTKVPRVQDVVPVEEEEHRLRMPRMDAERAYLEKLTARLRAVLGRELVGVYAGGSFALGGYEPGRSDLDVAAVVRGPLADDVTARIVSDVRHESLPCPARKLELVVYDAAATRSPSVDAAFELNLNTGANEPLRADTEPQPGESHWFAIDRSILAGHGVTLFGPPAAEVFAGPPREALLLPLAGVLRWYRSNEPQSDDAVLNAGRSLRFAEDGVWMPKPALRAWARAQERTKPEILDRVIAELERR
jgi:hypothetical protein